MHVDVILAGMVILALNVLLYQVVFMEVVKRPLNVIVHWEKTRKLKENTLDRTAIFVSSINHDWIQSYLCTSFSYS